jgi:acetyl esterase/lipase
MWNRLTWLAALLAVAVVGVLVWAFSPRAPESHEGDPVNDVVYYRPGADELKIDLVLPKGDGPFPAIVCLDGGGWTTGSRKHMSKTLAVMGRRGFVAAAPDVRLAPKYRYPACLDDAREAVRWLRANASKYKVDPKRIGVMGLSTGGHLALLLAATTPGEVQCVAGFSAPVDLASDQMQTPELLKHNLVPLLGGTPKEKPDAYRSASPLRYDLKGMPPVFLAHGSEDNLVPLAHARMFREKVGAAGGTVKLMVLEGEGHTWRGANLLRSIDRMLTFLDESLKK